MMPRLILINGAPGSGKSTLARGLADHLPLSLVLDVDTIRGNLGRWRDDPITAGLAARRLAVAMATTHLKAERDVIVPQFLQRSAFILELETAASQVSSQFIEVALVSNAHEAAQRFHSRSHSVDPNHADAQHLQTQPNAEPIEELYAGMISMLCERPTTKYVDSVPGAIEQTLESLIHVVNNPTNPPARP